jgi:DNA-binding NarL/FixJ family response regulator
VAVPLSRREGHAINMTGISLLVVDGQRTFADALASRLAAEPDLSVAAAAESAVAARRSLVGRHVDIVLLDSELTEGLHLAAELAGVRATTSPPVQVIMLGTVPEPARMVEAVRSGIAGWVPKEESIEQLLTAIRSVMSGGTWFPGTAVGPVLRLLISERDERQASLEYPLGSLTRREREVLSYLAEGVSRREVAERMNVSGNTVRSHLQNVMAKLEVHTTLEAVALVRRAQPRNVRPGAVPLS